MALEDGDPRTLDREIYLRLTRPERWAAVRRYVIRIGPGYRNSPKYPDDEAAASVARHSILMGASLLGYSLAGISAGILPVVLSLAAELGGTAPESLNTTAFLVVGWVGAVALLALTILRVRQVNRLFVERYPALRGHPAFWRAVRDGGA